MYLSPDRIRDYRQRLGWSQAELARRAEISLLTVHQFEAGRGNPSLQVLEAMTRVLGTEIRFQAREPDWALLARMGVPITAPESRSPVPKRERFLDELLYAVLSVQDVHPATESRERETLRATLFALQSHYPTWFKRFLSRSTAVQGMIRQPITGREIKLRRIALQGLAKTL